MSYCYEKGIPHSEFLTWEPEDRAKTMAYMYESAERCSLCGTAGWEWEQNRFAYEPDEKFCQGCYLKGSYAESLGKTLAGTTVELHPVTPQRRAKQQILLQKRRSMTRGD